MCLIRGDAVMLVEEFYGRAFFLDKVVRDVDVVFEFREVGC